MAFICGVLVSLADKRERFETTAGLLDELELVGDCGVLLLFEVCCEDT